MTDASGRVTALSPDRLRRLMARLSEQQGTAADIPRVPRSGPLPLSFAQERLWFLARFGEGGAAYHIPAAVRLRGPLDVAALEQTLAALIGRHEALRTVFGEEDGRPVQTVQAAARLTMPLVDLSVLPDAPRQGEQARISRQEASRPFDLATGPLLRALLIRCHPDDHLLNLTFHHIITDGWSLGVLVREVAALYPGIAQGNPAVLSELPIQPADYAAWERERLRGAALESELSFWRARLAGLPPLELPADRPRPASASFRGGLATLDLPAGTTRALEALAQRERATLFMALLALFQALLLRYTGQDDFGVGTPVANRTRSEIEGLIGLFVNTVVLRVDQSGGQSEGVGFAELLRRSREVTLAAFAHEELPFEKLVEELRPEREAGRNPLFQVLFTLQNQPWPKLRLGELDLELSEVDTGTARTDLALIWREQDGRLSGTLEYSADLFERASAERLLGHLAELLRGALADPERGVWDLPLLTAAERLQILEEWRGSTVSYPREATLHALVQERVRLAPEAIAVESGGERLTYAELDARANHLAHRLLSLGVKPDDRVGVALKPSVELVVGLLGILKAGGAYVPLDLSYPQERLDWMVDDAGLAALIHRGGWTSSSAPPAVDLDDLAALAGPSPGAPLAGVTADSLALILYTSGSTGRPKGVALPHRAVIRLLVEADYARLEPSDRVAQVSNTAFDAATFEIWGALLAGARLVCIPREEVLSPEALARRIADDGITTLLLTTALFNQMARQAPVALQGLRHLLFGGETADPGAVREVLRQGPPQRLLNVYGPTETATLATWYQVEELSPQATTVPIGRPLVNSTAYVVDRTFRPVPPGVPGELLLGGDGLARGYWGRGELTAERFVPSPFAGAQDEAGARLYRTGDLARWRPDGTLDFLGRVDRQVKIRGFRIEPGEIEAVLAAHPEVTECAVVVREDRGEEGNGDRRLVAYVVGDVPADALRQALRERLPDYMVPATFVTLAALPLTPNGKVDRKALPAPDLSVPREGFTLPGTPAEELLAGLWRELLGLDRVGARDNFFALGGHSLKGVQLASRMRDRFGVTLPVRQLFATPTVEGLARWLEGELAGGARPLPPSVVPVPRENPLPLSFAQRRLWFLDRLESGSVAYVVPLALELEGPLRVAALARSLADVLARHEVLRTVFPEREGEPEQVVLPVTAGRLPVVDLEGLPPDVRESEARKVAQRESSRPFDLERGPLVRFHLLRLGSSRHMLLGVMHHIVADAWSLGVLLAEVSAGYEGTELVPLAVQYADYAVWQRERLAGEELERELSYWRRRLAGVAPLELPTDRPRPSLRSLRGASLRFALPEALGAGVKRLALESGATPFMVFLTGFQVLLSRLSGQADLTVGSPVAGRGRSELEGLIGCFLNTLVLRAGFAESTTFEAALRSARGTVLEAHGHQEVPFERLVEELQPQRSLSHTPLFQVLLTYQESPLRNQRLGEASLRPVWVDRGAAQFDLTLELLAQGGEYLAGLEYNTSLFDRTTMERLAGQLERLLSGAMEWPERRLGDLSLLSEAERHQLSMEWNDSMGDVDDPELVHGMFERQAARSPGDRALTFGEDGLTYREINARANRLAHRLVRQGVGPEVRVGIQCERSPEMVVAMLAVLKAGGAYVPMDPAYPRERLALVQEDAGASLVLTRRRLNELAGSLDREPEDNPPPAVRPDNAAYVIYTSGSTGRPKGVVVTHRNAASFFAAMDRRLGAGLRGAWLAVTSISFDISVLEILWTLARGFEVVLQPEAPTVTGEPAVPPPPAGTRELEFSLFYFASEAGGDGGEDSYRLLLEGARFADRHGFKAVWTPERHFHAFGGLYPNPAVAGAALAVATERVQIRAGSVVMPLQSPLRVAEEWSVVDRLSRGRVGISFASGWHADDFVLAPESYRRRKEAMIEGIEAVRRLWRGEAVRLPNGVGKEVPVHVHPRPLQSELPVWLTAAGNEETFRLAGHLKAGLLTHLLGQSLEELAAKITAYRAAWREAGGEGEGHVTLMLHTFVGDDMDEVRETVRQPFRGYLRSSFGLLRNLAGSLGREVDLEALTPEDEELLLDLAFDRYFATSGLIGTPEVCLRQLDRLRGAGIDEIACLIDFGVETEATLSGLERLHDLKERSRTAPPPLPEPAHRPLEEQIPHHGITHLQCTPSMARMLVSEPAGVEALASLRRLLVGGEALPPALARQLRETVRGEVHNMYGPTETTVWSSAHRLDETGETVPIGRPLLNTGLFVLDRSSAPAPRGVPGELFIGGRGVVRGYLGRPDLTAERFVPDPFCTEPGGRLYATGDRARFRPDGVVEFLGRVDHQVKIRGHRIELGEIEAVLGEHPAVESVAVALREERPGEPVLAAYVVPVRAIRPLRPALPPEQAASLLAGHRRATLPNGMELAVLGDFQTQALYEEIFLSRTYLRHGIELRDGDCVFDVGANIGSFTLFASQQARDLRIHAFEPIPRTFETLHVNVGLYGLKAELHNCGLSSRSEEADLTFYPSMPGLSGRYSEAERDMRATREIVTRQLRERAGDSALQSIEGEALENLLAEQFRSERHRCRLRTLSEVMHERGVERIDLLKIDVERAEVDVLLGIEEGDWGKIGQIVMEVDGHENLGTIVPMLERRGFHVTVEELFPDPEGNGSSDFFYAHIYARRQAGASAAAPEPAALSAAALREFLRERLPAYMLPSHLVVLDALPLTPNGKIDRRALPPPESGRLEAEAAYEPPGTEVQKVIAGVWQEVLQIGRVGLHDNFFELGGTSLSLVEVRSRLRKALSCEVSLVDLFRSPTVASLALLLGPAAERQAPSFDSARQRARRRRQAIQQRQSTDLEGAEMEEETR
jgi:natural product biosynthesis luciferase-like monooxygenase protein/amino acid adenylation domain-containing protein/FkbM family methyltransferase